MPQLRKSRRGRKLSIARTERLLQHLGNPHASLRTVHITGTAGKGSVATMVQAGLVKAGHRTGLFTSPHCITAIERIQVDGLYIAPQQFVRLVRRLMPAVAKVAKEERWGAPTFFELMFAVALLYFRQQRCSYIVVEVGVGGRYDPTNVLRRKAVAALTNVDFDHTHLLGTTLRAITRNKAGIIRPGCAFFTAETRPTLLRQLHATCRSFCVPFHPVRLDRKTESRMRNRALAGAILRFLHVREQTIAAVSRSPQLPCRFERVHDRPSVFLDGAHSPLKMKALCERLSQVQYRKLVLILAMANNKRSEPILRCLVPFADTVLCTRFLMPFRKCHDPARLAQHAAKYTKRGAHVLALYDPHEALDRALRQAGVKDAVVATGSFFLAGELRKRWYSEEQILAHRTSFF